MPIKTICDYYDCDTGIPRFAEITDVRPGQEDSSFIVILDRTIFYPEGGGQPSDRGFINGYPVTDVKEISGEIHHIVSIAADNRAAPAAGKAELVLDSKRRRDFSACHTGQHLLSGVLFGKYGIQTASVHLGEANCFIDIDCADAVNTFELEDTINDLIEKNIPVITHLCPPEDPAVFPLRKPPPKEASIRIVEIEGVDFSPCCGTHLKSTGEIGMLAIAGCEKYKGMLRMGFIAGRRCLGENRLLRKNAEIASRALSVPISQTGSAVLEHIKKTALLEQKIKLLSEESNRIEAETLAKITEPVVIKKYRTNMGDIINIGKAASKLSPSVFLLISEDENKFGAFCGNSNVDLRETLGEKLRECGGRGGGSASFFQGSFNGSEDISGFIRLMTG